MTGLLTIITRFVVFIFLVSSMAGIGLGLTLQQIAAPLRNAKLVVFAVIANVIIARLLGKREPGALQGNNAAGSN